LLLDFVHCFVFKDRMCFSNWISSHPEAKGWKGTYCTGSEKNSCSRLLGHSMPVTLHMHLGSCQCKTVGNIW
jgi:hypothetical protein